MAGPRARAAIKRSQSIFAGFGAEVALRESAIPATLTSLVIGDVAGHGDARWSGHGLQSTPLAQVG